MALLEARIPTARVNPRDTHHFAQAHRQLAKTDRLDARGLMLFAAQMRPGPTSPPPRRMSGSKSWWPGATSLRRCLRQNTTVISRRLVPPTAAVSKPSSGFWSASGKTLDQAIEKHLSTHAQMRELDELLQTAKGVGCVVSATLIARLPELGSLSRRQIAALVGVAPYDRKSGDWDGRSHIFGGRADVRCALYMAALGAVRGDPHLRAFYRRLLEQGKEKKVALTACIRKLAIMPQTPGYGQKPHSMETLIIQRCPDHPGS